MSIRVRFAPSPTGLLHIGGLRTALYNYLLARREGGAFLLRIEDTDRERYVAEAEPDILESLRWAGLTFDEGPEVGGPHAPYYQSQRKDIYLEAANRLLADGHAYYAFDTPEEIEAMRARRTTPENPNPKMDAETRLEMKNSLTLPADEVEMRIRSGEPYVVRLKVPQGDTIRFKDLVRDTVVFESDGIDDQVLLKSDGLPTYHLANVVDDHDMAITHVIRGEEWLPSTPKHILLYQFLGWTPPHFAHLPLILSPNGGKLSKRNAEKMGIPVSVRQYRDEGYEPGALLNFLAFLGWNPGTEQELFDLDELVQAFSVDRVGSHGVQFNLDKLRWYNQQYLKRLPASEMAQRLLPYVSLAGFKAQPEYLERVATLMQERLVFLKDLPEQAPYFFQDPESFDDEGVRKRWKPDSAELVAAFADRLERLPDGKEGFLAHRVEAELRTLAEERGLGAGKLIHPVRLAVTGVTAGPGLFETMEVLGRNACVPRLRRAAAILG